MALTDKQQLFADVFWQAMDTGLPKKEATKLAREAAGYASTTSITHILTDELIAELISQANKRLALGNAKALGAIDDVMDYPDAKGSANKLAAAVAWLDRGGVTKKESKEITIKAPTGIVILPSKAALDDPEPALQ